MVIPKRHAQSVPDADGQLCRAKMDAVRKLSRHYVRVCGYDGVNFMNASGRAADQSVFHFHIHLIPRTSGDGIDPWPKMQAHSHSLEEMPEILAIR